MKRRWDGGYWVLSRDDKIRNHPLVARTKDGKSLGWVHEHKFVLYEKIGPGPHPCHWSCGRWLAWGGTKGIIADHADGDPKNNKPSNLVSSCTACNTNRMLTAEERSQRAIAFDRQECTCKNCERVFASRSRLRGHLKWCK